MGGAMSTKYLWCKDLPTTHKDSLGNRYCVFHAPAGKKKVQSAEAFNRLVFERVTEENTHGRACDLSGAVFEGRIDPKGFLTENPRSVICFANTTFPEDLDLSGVKFTVEADFQIEANIAATITNLFVYCSAGTGTITLRKNGAATALTKAITGAGAFEDSTNSVSVVAGDLIDYEIVTTGAGSITTRVMGCMLENTAAPPAAATSFVIPRRINTLLRL